MIVSRHGKICLAVLLLLLTILSPSLSIGQELSFQLSGYAKDLAIRSNSILNDEAYFLNISRLRTQGLLDFGSVIHTEIWLDHELFAGSFLSTTDFKFAQLLERPFFVDLKWTIKEGHEYQVRQSLFRAFATIYVGSAEITLGRQHIAWGTGFAWNPTDLLNPFNPAAIELDEKEGVDAAYIALPFGALSRLEAAFAPGRNELESSAAVRVSGHFGNYDISIMAGDFQDSKVLGGDFAGYLGGAGFRGEFAYTWNQDDENFLRAVLNVDYNFPHDFYAIVEFYYNGLGATDRRDYRFEDLLSGQTFSLAKHYLAASVTKSVTPLLRLSLYNILNLDDRSRLIGPTLTYSLATNLELAGSVYFFTGASDSEYGVLESTYFGFLQYYF